MAKNKIIKNASVVMFYSLLAKFSSFFVELLVASNLGVSKETDAFYMVYGIVQIIYPMISVGIWKVFLPEYKTRIVLGKKSEASEITNQLISVFSFISILIIGICNLYPKGIIFLFAPGFDARTSLISENLLRIVIFIIIFNTFSTFSSAILQSLEYFSKAQIKDVAFHVPTLIYLIGYREKCTVTGLAYSILCGSIFASILEYSLVRLAYRYRIPRVIINSDVLGIIKQVPIACLNSIINQLNNVIDKIFASTLATGAVTYLYYGSKLIHLFDGVFSTAISTALFPYITELVAKEEYDSLKRFLKNYILLISMILLPMSGIIFIYSREIVQIVFGHGKFNQGSVYETALVLLMYGIGLLAMCLTTIINDIFYIIKRTGVLLWTTVVNIISNIILDVLLVRIWGVAGLSLATTLSLYVALIIKLVYIRDIFRVDGELLRHVALVVIYCVLSSIGPLLLNRYYSFSAFPKLITGIWAFGVVYFFLILIVNKEMRNNFIASTKSLFKRGTNG